MFSDTVGNGWSGGDALQEWVGRVRTSQATIPSKTGVGKEAADCPSRTSHDRLGSTTRTAGHCARAAAAVADVLGAPERLGDHPLPCLVRYCALMPSFGLAAVRPAMASSSQLPATAGAAGPMIALAIFQGDMGKPAGGESVPVVAAGTPRARGKGSPPPQPVLDRGRQGIWRFA